MNSYRTVSSKCNGTIEKIYVHQGGYVHEWEPMFLIKTTGGALKKVEISSSGKISKVNVNIGDDVLDEMTLAILEEDCLPCGSD